MKIQRRTGGKREPLNWQGGCRFTEEMPSAELDHLLEDTLGHLHADLLDGYADSNSDHFLRLKLIGEIAERLRTQRRAS
jgi:hypothetical protein